MQAMDGINLDKWRKLNNELFDAYIRTYHLLSHDSRLDASTVMVESLEFFNIRKTVTPGAYNSAYTIAREIGIFYEEEHQYYLGDIAQLYVNNQITFSDYMKYYVLNTEFLIYEKVVHPFKEIVNALSDGAKTKEEIAQVCHILIRPGSPDSVLDKLRIFLDRCCLSELIQKTGKSYSISPKYNKNLLLGSITKSNLSEEEFKKQFITSKDARSNKAIVEMINNKIPRILDCTHFENQKPAKPKFKNFLPNYINKGTK